MTDLHDAWLAKHRARWLRPNARLYMRAEAQRFLRPDARRFLRHEWKRYVQPGFGPLFVHALLEGKANFNPDQPRVPAGHPDGGQWTDGDSGRGDGTVDIDNEDGWPWADMDAFEFSAARRGKADGHHYVPRQLFENRGLSKEAIEVFEAAKTGRLYAVGSNLWDESHRIYNQAVEALFDAFLDKRNIVPSRMTGSQAFDFTKEVLTSKDPRIRNHNMRIRMLEAIYRFRRGIRGNE